MPQPTNENPTRPSWHDLFVHAGLEDPLPPAPPPLTLKKVKEAVLAYFEETGDAPRQKSGDASKWFGLPPKSRTWCSVDLALRREFFGLPKSSLSQLCKDLGLIKVVPEFTLSQLEDALRAYHKFHGKNPSIKSGDASQWLNLPAGTVTWETLHCFLVRGTHGFSGEHTLFRLCLELGLAQEPEALTTNCIEKAILAFVAEKEEPPMTISGDATDYGISETWEYINVILKQGLRGLPGGSSLRELCVRLGLSVPFQLTEELVDSAVLTYARDTGKPPVQKNGDASKWLDLPNNTYSWKETDAALRYGFRGLPGGSSLLEVKVRLGLEDPTPVFTEKMIEKAIDSFHKATGKRPKPNSGNASQWVPFNTNWYSIQQALRAGGCGLPGGSSIYKICLKKGLVDDAPRRKKSRKTTPKRAGWGVTLTTQQMEQALLGFFREKGRPPTVKEGPSFPWTGIRTSWASLDQSLRSGGMGLPGNSSLTKLALKLGLAAPKTLTTTAIQKAALGFEKENGREPRVTDGDASSWFGLLPGILSWRVVDRSLRQGLRGLRKGSSLHLLCVGEKVA